MLGFGHQSIVAFPAVHFGWMFPEFGSSTTSASSLDEYLTGGFVVQMYQINHARLLILG